MVRQVWHPPCFILLLGGVMGAVQGSGKKIDLIAAVKPAAQPVSFAPVDPFAASAPPIDSQKFFAAGVEMLKRTPAGLALSVAARLFSNPKKPEPKSTPETEAQKDLVQVSQLLQGKKFPEAKAALDAVTKKYFIDGLIAKTDAAYPSLLAQSSLLSAQVFTGLKNPQQSLVVLRSADGFIAKQLKKDPKNAELFKTWVGVRLRLAEQESDPAKKLFYSANLSLLEGKHPKAQLELRSFMDQSKDSQDPQTLKLREEARTTLRAYSLGAIATLAKQNALLPEGIREPNQSLLVSLAKVLESGKADTLEEALTMVPEGIVYLGVDFWKNPALPKIDGGVLEIPAKGTPAELKLSFGIKGGYLKTPDGKTYHIMPAAQGHEILVKKGSVDVTGLTLGKDYLVADSSKADSNQAPAFSSALAACIEMQTEPGLAKLQGPAARSYVLAKAKELRELQAYGIAAELFETLFQDEIQKALGEVKPDQIAQLWVVERVGQKKTQEQIEAQLQKQKKENPEAFAKAYPQGWPSSAEIDSLVLATMARRVDKETRKLAFEKIDGWNQQGWSFEKDPIAKQAWDAFEDMMDPCDKVENLSDEGWDHLPEEIVLFAMISAVTMGTGTLVSSALRGGAVASGLLTEGGAVGVSEMAVEFGIGMARIGAESAVMLKASGQDLTWHNMGESMLTLSIFHRGGQLWQGAAKVAGIDAASVATAKLAGESVLGKQVLFHAGAIATPTGIAIGMDAVMGQKVTGESAALHLAKMGGFYAAGAVLPKPAVSNNAPPAKQPMAEGFENTIPNAKWSFARKGIASQGLGKTSTSKKVGNYAPGENEVSGVWEATQPWEFWGQGEVTANDLGSGLAKFEHAGNLVPSSGGNPVKIYRIRPGVSFAMNPSLGSDGFHLEFGEGPAGQLEVKYENNLLPEDRYWVFVESPNGKVRFAHPSDMNSKLESLRDRGEAIHPGDKIVILAADGKQQSFKVEFHGASSSEAPGLGNFAPVEGEVTGIQAKQKPAIPANDTTIYPQEYLGQLVSVANPGEVIPVQFWKSQTGAPHLSGATNLGKTGLAISFKKLANGKMELYYCNDDLPQHSKVQISLRSPEGKLTPVEPDPVLQNQTEAELHLWNLHEYAKNKKFPTEPPALSLRIQEENAASKYSVEIPEGHQLVIKYPDGSSKIFDFKKPVAAPGSPPLLPELAASFGSDFPKLGDPNEAAVPGTMKPPGLEGKTLPSGAPDFSESTLPAADFYSEWARYLSSPRNVHEMPTLVSPTHSIYLAESTWSEPKIPENFEKALRLALSGGLESTPPPENSLTRLSKQLKGIFTSPNPGLLLGLGEYLYPDLVQKSQQAKAELK